MNKEPNTQQQTSDEIDLLELFSRMWRGFKNAINWIINLIVKFFLLLIRKSLWIISFGIIGLVVGYIFYTLSKRFYSSEMTAISNSINNTYIVTSINLLNDLFKQKNYSIAANSLNIDINRVQEIKSIEAFYTIDINKDGIPDYIDYKREYDPKDTLVKRLDSPFVIRVEVYNESVFDEVRDGIKNYIYKNKFVVDNNNERIRQNKALIETIEKEIRKLDSLQNVEYFELPQIQRATSNQMVLLNEKERKLYHSQKLALEREKLQLEKIQNINSEPITVVQDFTPLSKAENPYTMYAINYGLLFAALGFAISIFWQYKRDIYNLISNRD
ncbi:MAG TPA: hypothetical protein ENN49_02885 [Bacteroidales bacterium]|nr:hypothetical protein [Bacteroidales bacterium]